MIVQLLRTGDQQNIASVTVHDTQRDTPDKQYPVQHSSQSRLSEGTSRKTQSDVSHVEQWLKLENNEHRPLEEIPKEELEIYLAAFFASMRNQRTGGEYEPGTLRTKKGSIDRYLKSKGSDVRISEMSLTKSMIKSKQNMLKAQGKGKGPNKAEALSIDEEEILWTTQMQLDNPQGLINAIWYTVNKICGDLNNDAKRRIKWGDVAVKWDVVQQRRYLEFKKRSTDTDANDTIEDPIIIWESPTRPDRCPVNIYMEYYKHRPKSFLTDESPFFACIKHHRRAGDEIWFKDQPMGEKMFRGMMRKMAGRAGLPGRKTNKSVTKTAKKHLTETSGETHQRVKTDRLTMPGIQHILQRSVESRSRIQHSSHTDPGATPSTQLIAQTNRQATPAPLFVVDYNEPSSPDMNQ